MIRECLRNGEIITVGDTNCHFGDGVDIRVETTNAMHLLRACEN